MIATIIIFINTTILLFLGLLHFYWVAGGEWGLEAAVPTKFKATFHNPMNSSKMKAATTIVGLGLLGFAFVLLSNYFSPESARLTKYSTLLTRVIGGLFIFRTIGDFNVFGIFKKERDTLFSQKDSQIFVPLCAYLGLSCILLTLI